MEVSVIIANILSVLIGIAYIKKIYKCTPTDTKHALHANFTYVHEKVILLGRSRLRALVVLIFGHDMQIQVAHALCKHGCRLIIRLISDLLQLRRVTIVPGLPYCEAIWNPVLKRDVDKLERVQRQGARWPKGAHGIVNVSGILRELGGKELASRRKEQRLTVLHKILHGELAIPHDAVVRLELSHSFIDSFDNHSTVYTSQASRECSEWTLFNNVPSGLVALSAGSSR